MVITVVLLHNEHLYETAISSGEAVTFGSHKKDTVQVPDFAAGQVTVKWKKNGILVSARKAYNYEMDMAPLDTMLVLDKIRKTALFLSSLTTETEESLQLSYSSILKVGRASSNDIVIGLPYFSSTHFTLRNEGGSIRVEDEGSMNGTYLNGKKITVAKMKPGDVISVLHVQIRLENGILYFKNTGDALSIKEAGDTGAVQKSHAAGQMMLRYKRSPRMQNKLPEEEIIRAPPPTKGQKFSKNKGGAASLLGQGAMMAASMMTTAASPALLAARAASLISPVTSIVGSGNANKARKKSLEQYESQRREKYGAYILIFLPLPCNITQCPS